MLEELDHAPFVLAGLYVYGLGVIRAVHDPDIRMAAGGLHGLPQRIRLLHGNALIGSAVDYRDRPAVQPRDCVQWAE